MKGQAGESTHWSKIGSVCSQLETGSVSGRVTSEKRGGGLKRKLKPLPHLKISKLQYTALHLCFWVHYCNLDEEKTSPIFWMATITITFLCRDFLLHNQTSPQFHFYRSAKTMWLEDNMTSVICGELGVGEQGLVFWTFYSSSVLEKAAAVFNLLLCMLNFLHV